MRLSLAPDFHALSAVSVCVHDPIVPSCAHASQVSRCLTMWMMGRPCSSRLASASLSQLLPPPRVSPFCTGVVMPMIGTPPLTSSGIATFSATLRGIWAASSATTESASTPRVPAGSGSAQKGWVSYTAWF